MLGRYHRQGGQVVGYYDYVFGRTGFYGLLYESQAFGVLKVEIIGRKPMSVV